MSKGSLIGLVLLSNVLWHGANKAFVILPSPHFNNCYSLSALPHILAASQAYADGGKK